MGSAQYDALALTNPLVYELCGGTNNGNTLVVFNNNALPISGTGSYSTVFGGLSALANSDATEPQNFYKPPPRAQDYTNYSVANTNLVGLIVPAPLVNNKPNFWRYDSSSPNRHNPNSYDLWAEFLVGNKNGQPVIETNGNW
jgi:hypothetical protein